VGEGTTFFFTISKKLKQREEKTLIEEEILV